MFSNSLVFQNQQPYMSFANPQPHIPPAYLTSDEYSQQVPFPGYQQQSQTNGSFNGQINLTLANVQAIPISTPFNSPGVFQSSFYPHPQTNESVLAIERQLLEQKSTGATYSFGFTGASVLDRILMSLQCGIETEEQWALGALVEMSSSANSF